MKAVIIGQGYVGLPVAMRAVEVGYDVVGIDLDLKRVHSLQCGISYVDDISDTVLSSALDSSRYVATSSYASATNFDIAIITVPTPLRETLPDLTFIEQAAAALAPHLREGATVVLESTTYPGTTEELVVPLLEKGSGLTAGSDFFVGYSPERIDPGNKRWGFVETPKVVAGINPESLAKVRAFYDALVDTTVTVSGTREAELTKLLENTFRHVNIALVNELAVFANQLGVNVWESIDAAATKPFGFMKFTPGPGVGGHCLPVDPSYLSWQVRKQLGRPFRFVELANDVNNGMPDYVVERIIRLLNSVEKPVKGSRILLVGLAYKPGTGDVREAPSLAMIDLLLGLGADLVAVDNQVEDYRWPANVARGLLDASTLGEVDLAVVITAHPGVDLAVLSEANVPVLDTRNTGQIPGAEVL